MDGRRAGWSGGSARPPPPPPLRREARWLLLPIRPLLMVPGARRKAEDKGERALDWTLVDGKQGNGLIARKAVRGVAPGMERDW